MYFHVWLQPNTQDYMLVADLVLNLSFEELEHRFLFPYRKGEPLINKGETVVKDNIGHLRIYCSSKFLGRTQYMPHRLTDFAQEITDQLITGPPGWDSEENKVSPEESRPQKESRNVFIVHGRNLVARDALFEFLRSLDLHPMEWSENVTAAGKASPYIGEILDAAFSRAHAVVVLFTPDDEARLKEPFRAETDPPYEAQLTGQARQNVLFEAGMAMARNQDRTVLVELGDLRPFSDIAGLHAIRLNNTTERRQELAQRLQIAGCPVSLQGTDWHKAGDFEAAVAFLEEGASEPVAFEERQPTIPDYKWLSEDAKSLLVEAANSATGYILRILLLRGWSIKANGKEFVEIGNRRSEVKWDQALKDLFDLGLVKDSEGDGEDFEVTYNGEGFEVTHKGYQVADVLEAGK